MSIRLRFCDVGQFFGDIEVIFFQSNVATDVLIDQWYSEDSAYYAVCHGEVVYAKPRSLMLPRLRADGGRVAYGLPAMLQGELVPGIPAVALSHTLPQSGGKPLQIDAENCGSTG